VCVRERQREERGRERESLCEYVSELLFRDWCAGSVFERCESVCVCVRERECACAECAARKRERGRKSVCVCVSELLFRDGCAGSVFERYACVCVCERERAEREKERVCVR